MKKSLFIFSLCATLFVTSCSENQSGGKGNLSEIDVESSFKHPQELSLFDLGKEFTYIPLETIDESLIKLNSTSNLAVTDDYIFIADSGSPILCFERKTGKYLFKVGNIGQGPQEYTNGTSFTIDPIGKRIYVLLKSNRFQCYNYEGKFLETIDCADRIQSMADAFFFVDDKIYHHANIPNEKTTAMTYCYDLKTGQPLDSLLMDENDKPSGPSKMVMPVMGTEIFGGRSFLIQYEDAYTYGRRLNSAFWITDGELYMKDAFCDTIFHVNHLKQQTPAYAFRLGEYGGYGRFESSDDMKGKYLIPNLMDGKNCLYFTLYKGLYDFIDLMKSGKPSTEKPSCGVYNKQTGELKIQQNSVAFKHPLEGMPEVHVFNVSTDGAFVVALQADELATAREEMPEEKQPEWLKQLKEDDNPVILLVQ